MAKARIEGDQTKWTEDDILYRVNNTWATLNIGASRIVGKKSSGILVALTAAETQVIIADSIVTFGNEVVVHNGNVVTN